MTEALLIVDAQNDFLPGGALPVPNGDQIIEPILNVRDKFDYAIITFDAHPEDHCSFKENGGIWPKHCVVDTHGYYYPLEIFSIASGFVFKGRSRHFDSYSAFYDDGGGASTDLTEQLRDKDIDTLYVCGLATEYCVKFTVLDALKNGFKVVVLVDAIRGINNKDESDALKEMKEAGAIISQTSKVEL